MSAYYNEFEPYAAEWLRNLIKKGLIADGVVDDRSIASVEAADLGDFTQCHFFAGIGVWSHALRLAGWRDDEPVWTGSCPCQPFSAAGKGKGVEDERHLWPEFHRLISQCRPAVVFGEQVASKDGLQWLDLVFTDLEASGYAAGAVDLCAAGVGAPHIRQRLWFVGERLADAIDDGSQGRLSGRADAGREALDRQARRDGADQRMADTGRELQAASGGEPGEGGQQLGASSGDHGRSGPRRMADAREGGREEFRAPRLHEGRGPRHDGIGRREARGMADAERQREWRGSGHGAGSEGSAQGRGAQDAGADEARDAGADGRPRPTNGHWRAADWLHCRDGKWRPVEPGSFPLAHGAAARVGRLRGYGNAIVAQAAAEVIAAFMRCRP